MTTASENAGSICCVMRDQARPNLGHQSASAISARRATMKSRKAMMAGSLRAVMTALRHSRQPQNGLGAGLALSGERTFVEAAATCEPDVLFATQYTARFRGGDRQVQRGRVLPGGSFLVGRQDPG